jgi:hypothetical protein
LTIFCAFCLLAVSTGFTQTNYWFKGPSNQSLNNTAYWATNADGSGSGVKPGALDTAIFSVTASNSIPLNRWNAASANQSFGSIVISNSGTNFLLRSGNTNASANSITMMFGITNSAAAGAFQLGDTDNFLRLRFGDTNTSFVIANNSSSTLTILEGAQLASATTNSRLLLVAGTGSGAVNLNAGLANGGSNGAVLSLRISNTGAVSIGGSSTLSGGTTLDTGTLALDSSSALGSGSLTINGGAIGSVGGSARTPTNAITVNGDFSIGVTNAGFTTQDTTFNGNVDLAGGTRTITMISNNATFGGVISNGGLTLNSAATNRNFTITNAATYTAGTTL